MGIIWILLKKERSACKKKEKKKEKKESMHARSPQNEHGWENTIQTILFQMHGNPKSWCLWGSSNKLPLSITFHNFVMRPLPWVVQFKVSESIFFSSSSSSSCILDKNVRKKPYRFINENLTKHFQEERYKHMRYTHIIYQLKKNKS